MRARRRGEQDFYLQITSLIDTLVIILVFMLMTVGSGQIIPGFDKAVVGMRLDEEKEVAIEVGEAYGMRDETLVKQFPRSKTTAKRDLADLRRRGLIEFDGSARTGFWRPKR
jgi:FKBP-type peptidyl-prolyl cis-trans isomerase 2